MLNRLEIEARKYSEHLMSRNLAEAFETGGSESSKSTSRGLKVGSLAARTKSGVPGFGDVSEVFTFRVVYSCLVSEGMRRLCLNVLRNPIKITSVYYRCTGSFLLESVAH